MGKVFVIASGKGGTGKTMFAGNIGATLTKEGKTVVVIDFDLGLRNMDLYYGMENNVVFDVYDVLTGVCKIKQALIKDKRFPGLYLMAASPEKSNGYLTPLHMKVLCDKLVQQYDYVIVDAPSGIEDGFVMASAGADAAVIVVTPDYSAIRDADNLDRELLSLGITDRYLVVNNVDYEIVNQGMAPNLEEISQLLKPRVIGVIPADQNIRISTNFGIPIVYKEGTYIEKNFRKIAGRLISLLEKDKGDAMA